jgi:predicted nucleic acid-binding protein
MSVEALVGALAGRRLVFLDTMVFSYQLSNHPRYAPVTTAVLAAVEAGQVAGVTTTISLAEILTVPARAGDEQALRDYELYLTQFPNLTIVPLDLALARQAALVRAATRLRTPDAIQVAAAQQAGAGAIVTNDRRWVGRVTGPALVLLEDYAG